MTTKYMLYRSRYTRIKKITVLVKCYKFIKLETLMLYLIFVCSLSNYCLSNGE